MGPVFYFWTLSSKRKPHKISIIIFSVICPQNVNHHKPYRWFLFFPKPIRSIDMFW
jgi:hypothetical protein